MNTFLLLGAAVLFAINSIAMKYVPSGVLRLTVLVSGAYTAPIFLAYLAVALSVGDPVSPVTWGTGLVWGVIYVITVTTYFLAMQSGPLSYTSFIYAASMVIPTLGGAVLWRENISLLQWLGIALFLAAFYLISVPGADRSAKIKKSWIPLCLCACICNGLLSVVSKAQQVEMQGAEPMSMLAVSFGSASAIAFLTFFAMAPILKEKLFPADVKAGITKSILPVLAIAASNGGGNGIVLYLASRVPGAWLYPCVLGGNMLLVTLFSVFFLKEKINRWGWLGILTGLVAMVVMNV